MCTLERKKKKKKKSLLMIFNLPNYLHQRGVNYLTHFGEMVALRLFAVNFLKKTKKQQKKRKQKSRL